MAHKTIIRETVREVAAKTEKTTEVPAEECIHCTNGWVFEPTEDTLHDEAHECPMCFGSGQRMEKAERLRIRAERGLDAHYSGLERMGG